MVHNYRDNWVDYAKGVGILLVVYGHVVRGLIKAGLGIYLPLLNLVDEVIYGFHMPLFFFLSGCLFSQSAKKWGSKKLFLNKVDTILYPYIIWSLIQGAVEVFLSRYTNTGADIASVLNLLWSPRAHFWFLYALFFIFIFCIFAKDWIIKNIALIFICSVFVLLFFPVTYIAAIDLTAHYLVFFVFGILFKQYTKYICLNKWMLGLYFVFSVFAFIFSKSTLEAGMINRIMMFVYALSCILLLSSFCMLLNNKYSLLLKVGQASLAIYLIHVIVGSGVRIVLNKFIGIQDFYILLLIGLLVSVSIPMIIWRYVGSIPLQCLFSSPFKFYK
ncbi:acyltransferase family protein [Iodobacter ciconiae]|uniref:Acyltransferase n=1 Tax=Iodobacter ciconiae TaxID=2496266 RepID=A0A3S8ZPH0_9NEIS|nr:acyltransferase [Iodobacter ciconiae]AZN35368.1 acyltransferase [Iodobacter ciconiae]